MEKETEAKSVSPEELEAALREIRERQERDEARDDMQSAE